MWLRATDWRHDGGLSAHRVVTALVAALLVGGCSPSVAVSIPPSGSGDLPRFGSVEHMEFVGVCMGEAGFEFSVRELGDGMRVISASGGQEAREGEALSECMMAPVEAGRVAPAPTDISVEELEELFEYWIDVVVPCLVEAGYPTNPPPSREAFVEAHLAGEESWHPMNALPEWNTYVIPEGADVSRDVREQVETAARARAACPTVPPR